MKTPHADRHRYYVYLHTTADTGEVFYVGKGSGRRVRNRASRNAGWQETERARGFHAHIIRDGLTETEALAFEADVISFFGREMLAVLALGGAGASGYKHTDAARSAMSEKRRGRRLSASVKQRMSDTIRSRPDLMEQRRRGFAGDANPSRLDCNRAASRSRMINRNPMRSSETRAKMAAKKRGQKLSVEHREKLSAALKGQKRGPMKAHVLEAIRQGNEKRKRAVMTLCGRYFESTLAASKATGARQGNIVNSCCGRARSAGGLRWAYAGGIFA